MPGTAGYLVFDPWTGTTQAVTHESVVSSSLDIAGWNLMSHVYLF